MRQGIKLGILFLMLLSIHTKSQVNTGYVDTLQYDIVSSGRIQSEQSQSLVIKNETEYAAFYYKIYYPYPANIKFNFDEKMIVVCVSTTPSGNSQLIVNSVTETNDKIIIKVHISLSKMHNRMIDNKYVALSLKKSSKQIEFEIK